MKIEDSQVVREVLDNLSYTNGYKDKLIEFNKQFNPYIKVKVSYGSKEFLFPLEKVI